VPVQVGEKLQPSPISPLSLGERARVRGFRFTRLTKLPDELTEQIPDSAVPVQVGEKLQPSPISPLSLRERVRVRGF
jgi:hypothetical protein